MTQSNETALASSVPFKVGRGLAPRNIDELWRIAQAAARSGLVPKGCDTPEKAFIAMQLGAEIGLSPLQSCQRIAVINGRPSLWGDGMLAVCQQAAVFDHDAFEETIEGEGEKRVATCKCRRKGSQRVTVRTFSVADAKKANLWGKPGPWQTSPDRMLQMRARSFALRDTFADLLCGIYTAEEVADLPPRAVDVVVSPVQPAAPSSRAAALAADLTAPAGPPPSLVEAAKAAIAHAVEPPDVLDDPEPVEIDPNDFPNDEDARHAISTAIHMLVKGANKAGLSRIRKEFNCIMFGDDELSKLSTDDLAQLRDALAGEQTGVK